MKTYAQLSPAQKRVVDLMRDDEQSYCLKSGFFNYQQIKRPNIGDIHHCTRTTLRILIKHEVLIINSDKILDRFILNEAFKDRNKSKIAELTASIELLNSKLTAATSALNDIINWDDNMDEKWGDPGERAAEAFRDIELIHTFK